MRSRRQRLGDKVPLGTCSWKVRETYYLYTTRLTKFAIVFSRRQSTISRAAQVLLLPLVSILYIFLITSYGSTAPKGEMM